MGGAGWRAGSARDATEETGGGIGISMSPLERRAAVLPLLLKEMRATTENLNVLVEHAAVLLHAAGAVGDSVQRVQETVRGTSRSLLVNLASMVAGVRAMTDVVKVRIHRDGGAFNGQGGMFHDR